MKNLFSDAAVELLIGVVTILISFGGSYVAIKENTARLDERSIIMELQVNKVESRVDKIEEQNREVMGQLAGSLNELNQVLAGMKVELAYIKDDVKTIKEAN